MKKPSRITIAIIAILLTLATVQATHEPGQTYDTETRVENLKFDRFTADDNWVISWDTVEGEHNLSFQYYGYGVSDVWITATTQSYASDAGKSELTVAGFRPAAGTTLTFRLWMSSSIGRMPGAKFTKTF
ncbi:MAG: hypothetical protein F4X87_02400 [Chloroflexi bacterium]|nr:hypothetical protein [Chloroflexota bacterium]